ncbi:protein unc-93 homolog B1 isoform X5 [Pyrgilauda ruficollis]|uniref:protein unc-93 homolog B1 isoform X5 n=1 Tax=Pyrgilauda ruficollis TaxID=221976 RepID=UPI001B88433E|nr:protein unc-93 homolog B1 isoform X5 [Pyrgilauda ruficollis]
MINRLHSSCSQERPFAPAPQGGSHCLGCGGPSGWVLPLPHCMTLLGLFHVYPPYPAEGSTLPRVPSQESPATGWARSCPGDVTPSALPSSPLALPRGTPPCHAPGHLPGPSFGVTPGQARALHLPIGMSPRPGTLAHPPEREGGSESSRAQYPLPRGTPRRQHPRRGLGPPEAPMEKDIDGCQDVAKTVPSAMLGTEGTDSQLDDFVGANPDYNEEEEEQKYFRRKRLGVIKNVVAASLAGTLTYSVYLGLLQMQLILHYDETYREVKYSNIRLEDIDRKVLMGINVTPVAALLYTPILIRFFGTKWAMFLAVGIYALFVSSNYWERYYTLVPSAVAIGMVIVPLWASMGTYIMRMAQKYYEYINYKEEQERERQRAPRDACNTYIIIFQTIFYSCFHLSFVCAQMPMVFFLNNYLYQLNHTLFAVKHCGTLSHGTLPGFNKTVLQSLPRSVSLIIVESALMAAAFLAMLVVLVLCGAAYRPMEEIDMRSIGWGNIFQLPFKHMRDYRLRHLFPLFIYSGFEVLFVCTGFSLVGRVMGWEVTERGQAMLSLCSLQNYGVCALGLERLAYLLMAYGFSASVCSSLALCMLRLRRRIPLLAGAFIHAVLLVTLFCWAPEPRYLAQAPLLYSIAALWGTGSALNKTGISILLGMLYKKKERQDFIFTIYHWWQALAIFTVYLWSGLPMKAKLSIMLLTLVVAVGTYLWMEQKVAWNMEVRLPRIPRPRHKTRGYRYLEDNSDETGSDGDGDKEDDDRHPTEATRENELPKEDGEQLG